jgi:hypothetical protein
MDVSALGTLTLVDSGPKFLLLRGDGRVGRQESRGASPSRKVVSAMAQPSDQHRDEGAQTNRRFGTGRSFEDLLNEVYRHSGCLVRDLERVQSYLEAVSRKRDNNA